MLGQKFKQIVGIAAFLAALVGCGPDNVNRTTPVALYIGHSGDFEERIHLKEDGRFSHSVIYKGQVITDESGRYSWSGDRITFERFTKHYDLMEAMLVGEGREVENLEVCYFSPPFSMLKPFSEDEYFLRRQEEEGGGE